MPCEKFITRGSTKMSTQMMQNNFNRVTLHLLKQNAQSRGGAINSSGYATCAYRGVHGRRCGVGFLIFDEHYKKELEGKSLISEKVWKALYLSGAVTTPVLPNSPDGWNLSEIVAGGAVQEKKLLTSIQKVHDTMSPDGWPLALKCLAEMYGLSYPHALVNEMLAQPPEQYEDELSISISIEKGKEHAY